MKASHEHLRRKLDQRDTPCTFDMTPSSPCVDRDNSSTIRDGILPMQGFDAS